MKTSPPTARRVAVVGLSFRFPGTTTEQYWPDLLAGKDLVTQVDPERWALDTYRHPDKQHPGTSYTFAAGSLGDISGFDAGFFGISPREAAMMDPQQRLLLEMSWEAFEHAGIPPSAMRGSDCGVYIGIASADYSMRMADDLGAVDALVATGNTASIAANRISYVFDLHGPSMALDTACSSSLVAFHQACRAIATGEVRHALAGGVSLHLHPYGFITFSKASMLSRTGRCRVFDASGDGYVRSEGGGMFLLKDYAQAVADGDPILAVVAHTAVNTDGRKSGLTVPRPQAQAELLERAYAAAGIDPASIDYLEAHGTGTPVGDPIETRAIGEALGKHRPRGQPLLIGSVKTNLGHLEAASGVAGLVKAIYSLQHREVPATIGVDTPNPNIDFDGWNLAVVTETHALKPRGKLVIGVNSFGFGGANAHVILETPGATPGALRALASGAAVPLVLSARSAAALKAAAQSAAAALRALPAHDLYDFAYSCAFRRDWHSHRLVVFGVQADAIAQRLETYADTGDEAAGDTPQTTLCSAQALPAVRAQRTAFVYSGNGAQWFGMGRRLLEDSPVFRDAVREVDAHFLPLAGFSLEAELAGRNGADRYAQTEFAQPALFAVQIGLTRLLEKRGIRAQAACGHSVGEVAAAWASGALSLADAVRVIHHRSRLQGTTRGQGGMTAAGLGADAARAVLVALALDDVLSVAAVNSQSGVTIAGPVEALAILEATLAARSTFHKRLDLDYAFHSPAMDAIGGEVLSALADLKPVATSLPFYSTVAGAVLDGAALGADYWWQNVRQPVQFAQTVQSLVRDGFDILLEIGPHPVLRNYIGDALKAVQVEGRVLPTMTRTDDGAARVHKTAGLALLTGSPVDWTVWFPARGRTLRLPAYPWQRERHWHGKTAGGLDLLERRGVHPLLGYALRQQSLCWENTLDPLRLPSLADHGVGGATPFPGTGFAELAIAAALAWKPAGRVDIEDLEIRAPLLLAADAPRRLRSTIDAQDGSIRIEGVPSRGEAEPWTLHAVARILDEPQGLDLDGTRPPLPTWVPDFDAARHDALTRIAGLEYGPAFRCLSHGWVIDPRTAVAVFRAGAGCGADLAGRHLDPAILDCTFQLIIHLVGDPLRRQEGVAFVPTRMGRIQYRADAGPPHTAQARILHLSHHALCAEFSLYDAQGVRIASIREARFRSLRLAKSPADRLRYLTEHAVPRPLPGGELPHAPLSFAQVRTALTELGRRCAVNHLHLRYTGEVEPLLEAMCARFVAEATGEPADVSAQDIWNSLVADYPEYFAIVHAVGRVGLHLAELRAGRLQLADVLPRDASLASLMRAVLGSEARQRTARALAELVAAGMGALRPGERFRVLEFSVGDPQFSVEICKRLDFHTCDYSFATPSRDTLDDVDHLKERFPDIVTRLVDPASDSLGETQHLAVVTLDFTAHDTAVAALRMVRSSLAPGGTLVVLGQHPSGWIDFVFGTDASYWSASPGAPTDSPQRPAAFWLAQLQALELGEVTQIELSPDTLSGPYFLVAQRVAERRRAAPPTTGRPRVWILQEDGSAASARLAARLAASLQQRRQMVVHSKARDRADVEALLRECQANFRGVDGILHLGGVGVVPAATPADVLARQEARCSALAQLAQACEATGTDTVCWLVTQGVGAVLLPGHPAYPAPACTPDAAVWGFARSLANEPGQCQARLIDLDAGLAPGDAAEAICHELETPDGELEILLSAAGARHVPRLEFTQRPEPLVAPVPAPEWVSLGFEFPGQLRNLRWEERAPPALGPQDVEVEVRATGLNFRDVMYALGLLSDEAVENGFAGATLGLEFAGVISRIGEAVEGHALGDSVVGFGPSSFATRVITQVSALASIPPGLGFEAAATIPSTFFTVYYALQHLTRLEPGERILIHGAAGGVGIAAIQLAKFLGAEIHATAGSDEKRDFLRLLGVEHLYDSRSLQFADQILAATDGEGVDVVLNSLAGEAVNRNLRVLKPFGRFVELGKRDFYENTRIGLRPFRNNISYFGVDADQLMLARPQLTRRLFNEMMALFADGHLHPLPFQIFEAEQVVDAFRYMQQARQIGKVVVTYRNGIGPVHARAPALRPRLTLAPEGSYLVTGGLGGFGLRTAEWLAERGAKRLVLLGRSGARSAEAQAGLARLHAAGVSVLALACDVTDATALEQALRTASAAGHALRGVVHAATVIEDGLVRNLDAAQIAAVLAPKLLGAQHLHAATRPLSLDFFVLFSSATTLFGNPGQASYVAGNMALEALAAARRAAGLPATCVRWGAIDDVGFLARNTVIKDALKGRMGGAALASAVALDALEAILLGDASGLGVMEFDWRALARFLPSASSPRFRALSLRAGDAGAQEDDASDFARMLSELSPAELQSQVIEMLKVEVGEILRVPPERIEPQRSIYDMGLDSLMGVELVLALETRFGLRLPVMALSQTPTLDKLAERLIEGLRSRASGAAERAGESAVLAQTQQLAAQHGSDISREDMARLADAVEARDPAARDRIIQ